MNRIYRIAKNMIRLGKMTKRPTVRIIQRREARAEKLIRAYLRALSDDVNVGE